MRTLKVQDVPSISGLPPGASISQKVKIAHVLFIPIFPLGLVWSYNVDGEMYKIDNAKMREVEDRIGKKNVPWYSFAGIILAAFIFLNYYVDNKFNQWKDSSAYKKSKSLEKDKVLNPAENSIFYLSDQSNSYVPLSVFSSTNDSISFLAPKNIGTNDWDNSKYSQAFFQNNNPTQNISFSKAELIKSLEKSTSTEETRILVQNLPDKRYLSLKRIESQITENLPYVNDAVENNVRLAYTNFRNNFSVTDTFLKYIDKESHELLKAHLKNAYKVDESIVADLRSGFYPKLDQINNDRRSVIEELVHYKIAIYTKQVYLKSETNKEKSDSEIEKEIGDFVFFMRLLDFGFLTLNIEDIPESSKIGRIKLISKDHAVLTFRKESNIISEPRTVTQEIDMFYQNGVWKINLASSVSYIYDQLRIVLGSNANIAQEYRTLVRKNIKEINDGNSVPKIWEY